MEFPGPLELAAIRGWCDAHRGSVSAIARLVVQHDGTRGIHYPAVSRTLAGKERNSLVIEAYQQLRALAKQQLEAAR